MSFLAFCLSNILTTHFEPYTYIYTYIIYIYIYSKAPDQHNFCKTNGICFLFLCMYHSKHNQKRNQNSLKTHAVTKQQLCPTALKNLISTYYSHSNPQQLWSQKYGHEIGGGGYKQNLRSDRFRLNLQI